MVLSSSSVKARLLRNASSSSIWRGYGCAVLALARAVEATPSSGLASRTFATHHWQESRNFSRQRRNFQSLDSVSSQNPLDILREVRGRIAKEKDHSPVLSLHLRPASTNISTLESKANVAMTGRFGRLYRKLPPIQPKQSASDCPRRSILMFLSRDCGVNRKAVDNAVEVYEKVMQEGELTPHLATYSRLHDVSAPIYQDILRYLLLDHALDGMESIICLREDLRSWLRSLHAVDAERVLLIEHLKRLDGHLQEVLSVWFVPGLLEHRRITYETTSASILDFIVRHEAVHPVSSLRDLRRRLGSDRRVFAIFHPTLPEQPLFVLYVALLQRVPDSMATIQKADQSPHDDDDRARPTVACFYSISSLRKGLVGVGMGEYLIHQTVERLQQEVPSLETFCTLSPIPGFRQWFETEVERHDWITQDDRNALAQSLDCSPNDAVANLLANLQSLDNQAFLDTLPNVREIMLRWTARYLYNEKHRRKPLDRVARFHISNGAIMDQLHWGADLSPKGWRNSFGLMVTYRYDLLQLSLNQLNFESSNLIPLGESFARYV